jgi:hypothetical protein
MFEVSSDIYFVVYNLYYIGQNNDLGARVGPIHRDGGSIINHNSRSRVDPYLIRGFDLQYIDSHLFPSIYHTKPLAISKVHQRNLLNL